MTDVTHTQDRQDGPRRTRIYAPLLVLLLSFNYGIVFFDRNALSFLMPFIQPELGLSATQIGLAASALSLTWSISAYALGHASDRSGRRKLLLVISTLVFSMCSVLTGFVGGFAALLAVRLVMGAAEGGVLPISLSIIASAVPERHRGLAMGITQNVGSSLLGTFLAPIVLVAMTQAFGWRSAFFIAAVPGLTTALLIWFIVRDRAPAVRTERPPAVLIGQLLRERNIVLCAIIAIVNVSYFLITMTFLPLYLVQVRGIAVADMGLLIAVLGISSVILSILFAAVADRIGRKPLLILGSLLGLLIPFGSLLFHGGLAPLAVLFFLGWSPNALFPLFMGAVPAESVDPRHAATAIGLIMALGESIGGVLSPASAGMIADWLGLGAAIWMLVALSMISAVMSLLLRETAPRLVSRRMATAERA